MLKNAQTRTYLRLAPQEYWLWERLDGTRSLQELVVAYFLAHGMFAFELITSLVRHLGDKQMLCELPQGGGHHQAQGTRRSLLVHNLLAQKWTIGNLDGILTALYRHGGWLCYTRPAQFLALLISVVGLYLFPRILGDPRFAFPIGHLGASGAMLWLAAIPVVVIHELGHALTTKHYGREVHSGGLMLFFGMPAAFVDTTDIWMEGKRERLAVTWAGPYTGLILGGLCALVLWGWPDLALAPLVFRLASIAFAVSLLNLNPLLKLDGYYLLADALEIANLHERALAFLQHAFLSKLRRRERFSGEEVFFAVFGVLAATWTVYIISVALVLWNKRMAEGVQALLNSRGDLSTLIVNSLLTLLAGTFLAAIGHRGYRIARIVVTRFRRSRSLSSSFQSNPAVE